MTGATSETLSRDGLRLALHSWPSAGAAATLFYVHGTQSHAGWLFETGPALAAAGVRVYALDRRGSGASGGARGDAASYREWLDDYRAALALVRDRHPGAPLTILGQSLGGAIAAVLAVEAPELHDALLLSAPAFDLLSEKVAPEKRAALQRERPAAAYPVRVSDDQYTRDPDRLAFMARDERMARELTGRFLAAQLDLEERIRELPPGCLPRPAALLLARADSIIHLPVVRERFRLLAPDAPIVELPCEEHYLEFSSSRSEWWSLASRFAGTAGARLA